MRLEIYSGSFEFNYEDVASVTRVAIECLVDYQSRVEDVVLFGDDQTMLQDKEIKSFVEAHKFLSKLIVNNKITTERNKKDPECLKILNEVATVARKAKFKDYLAMGLLGNLGRFATTLEGYNTLIAAAKGFLDIRKSKKNKRKSIYSGKKRKRKKRFSGIEFPNLVAADLDINYDDFNCSICRRIVAEWNKGGEICCSKCMDWFHLPCLNLPPDFPQTLGETEWFCTDCKDNMIM